MNTYRLTIKLESDLCPGSGFDYAGVIDSDICADSYGLPYIPARRLKGCFRETAQNIFGLDEKRINSLFGRRGDDGTKGFTIKNAYLKNADDFRAALEASKRTHQEYSPEQVLEQFTSVRAQTSLENGVARKETLRYTRVIDCRNSVYANEEKSANVEFIADVFCRKEDSEQLTKIVKATKNIGLQRNRGLGSVRCALRPVKSGKKLFLNNTEYCDPDDLYDITFTVRNVDPLEICGDSDDNSLTYINGASVRGCLAANFFNLKKDTDEKEKTLAEFERIFLSETIFNNLYPSKNTEPFYPVPLYLRRLKKTKDLVNVIAADQREPDKDSGNRPRKISDEYFCVSGGKDNQQYDLIETGMELQYHHSSGERSLMPNGNRRQSAAKEDTSENLYILKTIAAGQYFTGKIRTFGRNAELITNLLECGSLSFGKSKSAQYGRCELKDVPVIGKDTADAEPDPSGRYVLVLASDALIRGTNGEYTIKHDDVISAICSALASECGRRNTGMDSSKDGEIRLLENIHNHLKNDDEREVITQYIETRMVYGYNTRWNLKRPSAAAVSAGSCIAVSVPKGLSVPAEFYIGDRQQEGYGHILVYPYSDMTYRCEKTSAKNEGGHQEAGAAGVALLKALSFEKLRKELLQKAFTEKRLKISPTALGRATLMLRESYKQGVSFMAEFSERYKSIKTKSTRDEVASFTKEEEKKVWEIISHSQYKNKYFPDLSQDQYKEQQKEQYNELLYEFMLTRLTSEKYRQKTSVKRGGE